MWFLTVTKAFDNVQDVPDWRDPDDEQKFQDQTSECFPS